MPGTTDSRRNLFSGRDDASHDPLRIGLIAYPAPFLPLPPPGLWLGPNGSWRPSRSGCTSRPPGDGVRQRGFIAAVRDRRAGRAAALWQTACRVICRTISARRSPRMGRARSVRRHAQSCDTAGLFLASNAPIPVVTTFHGRLDAAGFPTDRPSSQTIPLVAISEIQRRLEPDCHWPPRSINAWTSRPRRRVTGLRVPAPCGQSSLRRRGRGAIDVARRTGQRLSCGECPRAFERSLFERLSVRRSNAGIVDWRGEVDGAPSTGYGRALATLMLGAWPSRSGSWLSNRWRRVRR